MFENLVVSELIKSRLNNGLRPNVYFWRDNKGIEIDCIIENGNNIIPAEIKSGNTFNQDYFKNINYWNNLSGNIPENSWVVYGGDITRSTKDGTLLSWNELYKLPV